MVFSRNRICSVLVASMVGATVLMADGSQYGTLLGKVKDAAGKPVAGATIRITGPTLMGERIVVTEDDGSFRVTKLPPGINYSVSVISEGYQTATMGARVNVDQVYDIAVDLQPAEQSVVVEVMADVTTIDTSTVVASINMTKSFVDALPMPYGRTYQGILALAPGVTGTTDPVAMGGRKTENLYLVDGVDTTDATSGMFGMNLNEEAIEEVQVLTAGLSAEYGRVGGAVTNVVTKSGSNEWFGSLRYDFSNQAWDAQGKRQTKPESKMSNRPFVSVGGPIFKDKLWFFVTGQFTKEESTQSTIGIIDRPGIEFKQTFKADPLWYSAKLSWQINQNNWITFQATGDPSEYTPGRSKGSTTTLDTLTHEKRASEFMAFSYQGVPRQDLNWELKLSRQVTRMEYNSVVGADRLPFWDVNDRDLLYRYYENCPEIGTIDRNRDQISASVSWYPGTHALKMGVDVQKTISQNMMGLPGNQKVVFGNYNPDNPLDPYTGSGLLALWIEDPPSERESKMDYRAFYVNDKWRLSNNLAFNLGVRWENSRGENDAFEKIWNYNAISPRLGVSWDFVGNGRQSLGLFWARYAIPPLQSALDDMSRQPYPMYIYFYQSGDPHLPSSYSPDGFQNPFPKEYMIPNPNLKAAYDSEWTLSYKQQISSSWSLDSMIVARDYRKPLVVFRYEDEAGKNVVELDNAESAKRQYRAWISRLAYLGSDFELSASYTLSSLKGNIDADDHNNRNGGPVDDKFGYGYFAKGSIAPLYNDRRIEGYLAADQTHVFRLMAAHRLLLTRKVVLEQGFHGSYESGSTWTAWGQWQDPNPPSNVLPVVHPISENGERGDYRFPNFWRFHYSATFKYQITPRIQASFAIRVLNLLNTFKMEKYRNSVTLDQDALNTDGKVIMIPNANFYKPTRFDDWTPGRQLLFTAGLRF